MTSSFRKSLVGTRFVAGTFPKGEYVEGGTSVINFKASVQPLKPNEMQLLPEGRRESEAFRLYTDFQLKTVRTESGSELNADNVTIDGENFEVLSVAKWKNNVLNHFKAVVALAT